MYKIKDEKKGFVFFFFFFKQKTAYDILSGLVGSEICIRMRPINLPDHTLQDERQMH